MRSDHLIISLVGLLMGFLFLFFGAFLFLTAYIPAFSLALKKIVLQSLDNLSILGLALFFAGAMFLAALAYLNRRRYYLLQMGGVAIEDSVIAYFVKECVQKFFPDQLIACEVIVRRKGRLEILATIPTLEEEKMQDLELALTASLRKQCQLKDDFILNLTAT